MGSQRGCLAQEPRLREALGRAQVRKKDLTFVKAVELKPGASGLKTIRVEDPTSSEARRADDKEGSTGQLGNPFYGALAVWTIVPEKPPEEDPEYDSGENPGE